MSVCCTPDGKHIISGSKDDTIKIWSLEKMEEVKTLSGHSGKYTVITPWNVL